MVPVRAKVRGTRDDHSISISIVSPGATGAGSGTRSTVSSSGFPSSGAMKAARAVRSVAGPPPASRKRIAVTSVQPQSASGRASSPRPRDPRRRSSRIQVDRVFFQAL